MSQHIEPSRGVHHFWNPMTADIERAQPLEADDAWPWLSQRSLANGGDPISERTRKLAAAQIHPQCGSDAFDIVDR